MECFVHDIPVYYEIYGSGVPIIAIHGFTPDHRLMTGALEPLLMDRPGWRRIYLDLPGMGKTPSADHLANTDAMLELVLAFIEQVIPGERFLLAGESYGGYLSRGIVQRIPERVLGLALICPLVIADPKARELPPHTVIFQDKEFLASLPPIDVEAFSKLAVVQDRRSFERTHAEILSGVLVADNDFLGKLSRRYGFTFDVDALPQPFDKPSVFFLGRQDSAVGYRDAWKILENYPRATFAVIDRAGHNGHIEAADLFNALVAEWLDRVRESMEAN